MSAPQTGHARIPRFLRLFCVPVLLGWLALTALLNVVVPQLECLVAAAQPQRPVVGDLDSMGGHDCTGLGCVAAGDPVGVRVEESRMRKNMPSIPLS